MIVLYGAGFAPAGGGGLASESNGDRRALGGGLRWQSQLVMLAIVPVTATWVMLAAGTEWPANPMECWQTAGISVGFAALVFAMRAATLGAAITGGIFTAALYLQTPGWRTALWPLLALFLLTHAATRFGRRRKEALGTAEEKHGRRASQVAANLGVAVLAGIPVSATHVFSPTAFNGRVALVAMLAALGEATADTVSSEIGQVLGGEPRLVTSFRRVAVGTDGAVSLAGTLSGCVGAAVVVAVGGSVLLLSRADAGIAVVAAIAGLLIDSVLGALPERRGWLNNDAVNTLSTLAAALLAGFLLRFFPG